jgi:hypothetical protein
MNIPGIPDRHLSLRAWEHAWTQKITETYNMIRPSSRVGNAPVLSVMLSTEDDVYTTLRLRDKVCNIQRKIVNSIIAGCTNDDTSNNIDDFDVKWTAMVKGTREKLILDGMYHVCSAFEMDTSRLWCPDVTVEALEADGGNGFLKMLKLVLPTSITTPQPSYEMRVFPHLVVDQLLTATPAQEGNPNANYWIDYVKVERTLFISLVIHNVILGFVSSSGSGSVRVADCN